MKGNIHFNRMHAHAPLLLGVCSVVRMFKPKECGGEGKFKLIEEFAKNTKLKVMLSCGQCSQAAMLIDYNMIHGLYIYTLLCMDVHIWHDSTFLLFWRYFWNAFESSVIVQ